MHPLKVVTRLAFPRTPEDLLSLAGEALSRMWSNQARAVWQFTQGATPLQPSSAGSNLRAIAGYVRRYDNGVHSGSSQESVRLTCIANRFEHNQQFFSGFILEFSDSQYGVSPFEAIVVATCFYLTQMLREKRWLRDDEAPGLWQLSNRGWSDPIVVGALGPGPYSMATFLIALQNYGLFADVNPNTVQQGIWVRKLFNC